MSKERVKRFKDALKKAQNIVITTHVHPDADGIGSQVALCMALTEIGKSTICLNEETLLKRYHYLDPKKTIRSLKSYKKSMSIDLLIVVDANSTNRIGPGMEKLVSKSKDVLFIDHHPCPKEVENLHCVDTSAAATGQVVGELVETLNIKFTPEMALPLYTAILIDTSSFRYPTVKEKTHQLIGKLLATGIRPHDAYNKIYGAKKLDHMRLLGKVLSTAQANKSGEIAWIKITEKMLDQFNVDSEDTHAFVNHLLILDRIKVACMFRNLGKNVKISLRSNGEIDVGKLAQALGGGGHDHAAATIIEGSIDKVIPETIKKLELILKSNNKT